MQAIYKLSFSFKNVLGFLGLFFFVSSQSLLTWEGMSTPGTLVLAYLRGFI
jgi:hypothetical protein